jgi:thioredoxin 1
MVQVIADKAAFDETKKGNKLVVVDFYADWCGPCKRIAPIIEELAKENAGVFFCKVNVDDNEKLTQELDISAMPTFIFLKDGVEVKDLRLMGADAAKFKLNLAALQK